MIFEDLDAMKQSLSNPDIYWDEETTYRANEAAT